MKVLITLLALILLQSCSNTVGDIEKNLAETDKIYGKCNNPNRQFTYITKKICEDQERAAGPDGVVGDPINLTEIFSGIGGNKKIIYAGANSNQFLWNGALETLKEYPLMTVDSQGGFISTDWILEEANPDQRCMIKINITSRELISNGVNTKILCQKKETEEWYSNNEIFIEEEKNITLKILEKASQLSKIDSLS